jgi:hypothetical protein
LGHRIGAQAIGGAVLIITASALIWVGTAFAGYAIYLALLPQTTAPWAAAIAAVVLVIGPLGWAAIVNLRRPATHAPKPRLHQPDPRIAAAVPPAEADSAALNLLAKVAQEKPLLAVVFAGILGASEAIANKRNQT